MSEACDGLRALELARKEQPCLVVLDLMLPGLDGLEVCRRLQVESMAPVIMLTARVEEADRLEGTEHWGPTTTSPSPSAPGNWRQGSAPSCAARTGKSAVSAYPEL